MMWKARQVSTDHPQTACRCVDQSVDKL